MLYQSPRTSGQPVSCPTLLVHCDRTAHSPSHHLHIYCNERWHATAARELARRIDQRAVAVYARQHTIYLDPSRIDNLGCRPYAAPTSAHLSTWHKQISFTLTTAPGSIGRLSQLHFKTYRALHARFRSVRLYVKRPLRPRQHQLQLARRHQAKQGARFNRLLSHQHPSRHDIRS